MSTITASPDAFAPESQAERRVKYGAIVGGTIVVAILLAGLVVFAAERKPKRVDTTAAGLYSLKPQTVNIIKDNKQKIRITSLYTKAKSAEEQEVQQRLGTGVLPNVADQADKVNDLLEEYRSKGKDIEVDAIDPIANPTKVSDLIAEVIDKYGGQVGKYRQFVGTGSGDKEPPQYAVAFKDLGQLIDAQYQAIRALPLGEIKNEDQAQAMVEVLGTLRDSTQELKQLPEQIQKTYLREKPPLYKKAADAIKEEADLIAQRAGSVIDFFKKLKDTKNLYDKLPAPVQKYVADSVADYQKVKDQADALSKQAAGLGELKLDTLSDALRQRNAILVRGESDWKVIPYDQVWRRDRTPRRPGADNAVPPVRFAGEQMITSAIYTLQHPQKLKVAFVRAGGEPVTTAEMFPFVQGGIYSGVAEALREYNYDVVDKDLTGMAAMRQQQQMGQPPEPSEEEIRDAVWVVVDNGPAQSPFGGGPPTIAPKVMEHLAHGGNALFLVGPQADDMALALKDWGVEMNPSAVIVHEPVKTEGARGSDIDEAMKLPFLFTIRDWGDSPVTAPLKSLPGVLIYGVPVKTSQAKGVKAWPILPVPESQKTWGETDLQGLQQNNITFDDKTDLKGPFHAGVVAEKEGAGRLVIIGSAAMPNTGVIAFQRDDAGRPRGVQFPGNRELFMDSIFWLSHQEPMIAISPAAMDVSRIEPMSRFAQNAWRGGVLLVLLPALVVALGATVFVARRD